MENNEPVRLNRFLAQLGVGSRRFCDELILAGKVRVDGKREDSPGRRIEPGKQSVEVDGARLLQPAETIVLLLHKPRGVVSTVADPQGRPTVVDYYKRYLGSRRRRQKRVYPVGRLDVNTTGALLITNDGMLCYRLTHPRFEVKKTYVARVRGYVDDAKLKRLRRMAGGDGGSGGNGRGSAAPVEVVKQLDKSAVLRITLREGRNRQVRRMCEAVGLNVVKLKRVSFGPISIRDLPVGSIRPLTAKEIKILKKTVHLGET